MKIYLLITAFFSSAISYEHADTLRVYFPSDQSRLMALAAKNEIDKEYVASLTDRYRVNKSGFRYMALSLRHRPLKGITALKSCTL